MTQQIHLAGIPVRVGICVRHSSSSAAALTTLAAPLQTLNIPAAIKPL
jgi:hypothetical protein